MSDTVVAMKLSKFSQDTLELCLLPSREGQWCCRVAEDDTEKGDIRHLVEHDLIDIESVTWTKSRAAVYLYRMTPKGDAVVRANLSGDGAPMESTLKSYIPLDDTPFVRMTQDMTPEESEQYRKLVASRAELEREVRHHEAVAASDFEHLRQTLLDAANRLSDLADEVEKEPDKEGAYRVEFLRRSAERCRLAADGKS